MSHQSTLIPAKHRDKLKVLLVLKGYSKIACGRGMKANKQQKELNRYVYGDPPNHVSNIDLLCKGLAEYSSLYEDASYNTFKDGEEVNVDGLKFCPELIMDYSMPYYAGVHIVSDDIKSTNRTGKITCATPKTSLSWA